MGRGMTLPRIGYGVTSTRCEDTYLLRWERSIIACSLLFRSNAMLLNYIFEFTILLY